MDMGSGTSKLSNPSEPGAREEGGAAPAQAQTAVRLDSISPVDSPGPAGRPEPEHGRAERAVVYLGASAPVHATHTRMIRALIDEGFDHVFVFILCWSPDRHGVTAESGAAQLAKWLLGFPTADRAKVHLDVVTHEGEGAIKMRTVLAVDAQVEVCFSQKYSDQLDRIKTNWLVRQNLARCQQLAAAGKARQVSSSAG